MKTKKWILSALLAVLVCGTAAAQTPMQQSRTAFEDGDYERAAQICELAGDRVTDASEKRFLSTLLTMCQDCIRYRDEGDRLYRSGYFAEALTCYSRLLSLNPQDAYAAGRYRLATAEVETARHTSERALAVTTWTPASFRRFADLYPSDADTPAFLGVASYLSGGTVLPDLLVAGAKVAQEFGKDAEAAALLSEAARTLYAAYRENPAFVGWYLPDETEAGPAFSPVFLDYVNRYAAFLRALDPGKKILIAPYGTQKIVPDETFVEQLRNLDVDYIAYQDEVGVQKSTPDQTGAYYEGLRRAHDAAGRSKLWADMEIFRFEGKVYASALLPADIDRIRRQMEALSPHVEKILVYAYPGMMARPGSIATYEGHASPETLYNAYQALLEENHLR